MRAPALSLAQIVADETQKGSRPTNRREDPASALEGEEQGTKRVDDMSSGAGGARLLRWG